MALSALDKYQHTFPSLEAQCCPELGAVFGMAPSFELYGIILPLDT